MKYILIVIELILILMNYITLLKGKKDIKDKTTFDYAKELNSYDEINVIASKNVKYTCYNTRRNILYLTNKFSEKKDSFSLSIVKLLTNIKNANKKYLNLYNKFFKNIYISNISPILVLLITTITKQIQDAQIGIIFLTLIFIYQYVVLEIFTSSNQDDKNISKIIKHNMFNILITLLGIIIEITIILKIN